MITASPLTRQLSTHQLPRWQRELARAITDPQELCRVLGLDPAAAVPAAAAGFRLRVPRGFVARMRRGDPADPLLRQVWPDARELVETPGFCADPLAERALQHTHGLLHKYQGRALLITTGACAVHCRYCFRREFPYAQAADPPPGDTGTSADKTGTGSGAAAIGAVSSGAGAQRGSRGHDYPGRWREALAAIAADPSIEEVILSGGDPLSLSDARLAEITRALAGTPHVRRLRLHTRQPIVLPERVDEGLLDWLAGLPWPVTLVVHCNHANEIDTDVHAALLRLRAGGVMLLNQSVLLAGVNDDVATLRALSEALYAAGVLPYYLHLLDPVRGAAHFKVEEDRARALVGELAACLSGYLVPRLARELPGAPAKLTLAPILPEC
jgi:L-lysine 2,3-aminomutase